MVDHPPKNGTAQVVEFPNAEEKARRLRVEVERLARLSPTEWMFYLDDTAKKHGIVPATLTNMVKAVIKAAEKQAREDRGELRRREDRAERQRTKEKESERKEERRERVEERRRQEREEREARNEAEREEARRKKCEAAFAEIADLPALTHEVRLREAANRLGEDFETLVEEFEVFLAARTTAHGARPHH